MPKFVTMCEGGVVRSVSMALVLKADHDQDAIACSWRWNPLPTRIFLFDWADYVILMQPHFIKHVPEQFHDKVRVVDVGPDHYGNAQHPQLRAYLSGVTQEWSAKDWKI